MMAWLLVKIVGFVLWLAVIAAASYVALFVRDGGRREMGYRVLKLLVLGAATSAGALVLMSLRLRGLAM